MSLALVGINRKVGAVHIWFAAASAFSFPGMPLWLGIQNSVIFLLLAIIFLISQIVGSLCSGLSVANKTDRLSVQITKVSVLLLAMWHAFNIASASAVNMELNFGRRPPATRLFSLSTTAKEVDSAVFDMTKPS